MYLLLAGNDTTTLCRFHCDEADVRVLSSAIIRIVLVIVINRKRSQGRPQQSEEEQRFYSMTRAFYNCCVLKCVFCFMLIILLFGALVMFLSHLRRLNLDLVD